MNFRRLLLTIGGALFVVTLSGCQRTPEDIERWKAEGNTAKLVSVTMDSRQFMRLAAIDALKELNKPAAIKPLTRLFNDPDAVVVHAAVDAVASIGGPDSEVPMLMALELDTYPARQTAAIALGELKSGDAVALLIKALGDRDNEVAAAAAEALGKIGDPAAIPALCEAIKGYDQTLTIACAQALCRLSGKNAVKGLVPVFDNISPDIREMAVHAFIELGEPAIPYAYDALRSDSKLVQSCGISILEGLDAVPQRGDNGVWYLLASTCVSEDKEIDTEVAGKLAGMGADAIPLLLEGASSKLGKMRETSCLALELIGELAAEPALVAAGKHAIPAAREWLGQRNSWRGAPSWKLDLWGGITALSPYFMINPRHREILSDGGPEAVRLMKYPRFKPEREYIPLLIHQLTAAKSKPVTFFGITVEQTTERSSFDHRRLKAATERLAEAGASAVCPLIVGLGDPDIQVAEGCAYTLGLIGDTRAIPPLLEHLEQKIKAGENLTGSDFYSALQKFNDPSAKRLLAKIRPNAAHAEKLIHDTYPNVEILRTVPYGLEAPPSEPISYAIDFQGPQQIGKLTITFRKTVHGDWIPHPPLPDSLPE